jgi:hypothetical protein
MLVVSLVIPYLKWNCRFKCPNAVLEDLTVSLFNRHLSGSLRHFMKGLRFECKNKLLCIKIVMRATVECTSGITPLRQDPLTPWPHQCRGLKHESRINTKSQCCL